MTRAQFLNDLYRRLAGNGMDAEQAEQHLTYYAEMLADRMEEGMDEDAAVESMEDVETIARRILEEEGLSYTPPGPGGWKRAYQAPKRRMKPAQIALWAVAILCAVGAIGRWAFLGMSVWRGYGYNTAASEGVSMVVDRPSPVPMEVTEGYAPLAEAYGDYALEVAYEYGYSYSGGITSCLGSDLKKLDIEWASGMVYVQSYNGNEIQIQEYSRSELTGRNTMVVESGEEEVSVRYRDGASLGTVKGDKWLTVLLPDGMVDTLTIETTSADVWLSGLEQGGLDVSTASGRIDLSECYFRNARMETISGVVNFAEAYTDVLSIFTTSGEVTGDDHCVDAEIKTISGDVSLITWENAERIKAFTTSGEVWLSIANPAMESVSVDTTSGHVSLSVPYDMGMEVKYSTVSGMFNSSWIDETVRTDGKIVHNGGGCEVTVDTISGHLDIY